MLVLKDFCCCYKLFGILCTYDQSICKETTLSAPFLSESVDIYFFIVTLAGTSHTVSVLTVDTGILF